MNKEKRLKFIKENGYYLHTDDKLDSDYKMYGNLKLLEDGQLDYEKSEITKIVDGNGLLVNLGLLDIFVDMAKEKLNRGK